MKRETSSKAANDDQNGKCQTQEKRQNNEKRKKIHRQGKQGGKLRKKNQKEMFRRAK